MGNEEGCEMWEKIEQVKEKKIKENWNNKKNRNKTKTEQKRDENKYNINKTRKEN